MVWTKQDQKECAARWYRNNRERHDANVKKWKEAHKDELRAQGRVKSAKWRKNNPEKARESSRLRSAKWRKNNPEKSRESRRKCGIKWRKANPEKVYTTFVKWKKKNPEKRRAHNLVFKAKIPALECIVCGSHETLERHHPDYSKPLEIVVLCNKGKDSCHFKEHKYAKKHGLHSMRWWNRYIKKHEVV